MSWLSHRKQRTSLFGKVASKDALSFYNKINASRERRRAINDFTNRIIPIPKTNFEKQVEEVNKLKAEQLKKLKEEEEKKKIEKREQENKSSIIKKINAKLSDAFVKRVRERGNQLADAIEKNKYLTPTKKKIYLTILDFTVSSILEDAKSLEQYEKELIEKKYPPEYVQRGVNWFIYLTK